MGEINSERIVTLVDIDMAKNSFHVHERERSSPDQAPINYATLVRNFHPVGDGSGLIRDIPIREVPACVTKASFAERALKRAWNK